MGREIEGRKMEAKVKRGVSEGKVNKSGRMVSRKVIPFILLVLFLAILGFLTYLNMGIFLVALVNNKPIWRLELIRRLEKEGGKQMIDVLINKSLVYQEAMKRNVSISDEDINKEYSKLESQFESRGISLQDAMALQGLKEEDVREELKYNLLLKSLLSDRIVVSDEEARDYFNRNKEAFDGTKSFEDVKGDVKDFLASQKLSQIYQSFIDELKSSSKIRYFGSFN